jgi:hypothetical protein
VRPLEDPPIVVGSEDLQSQLRQTGLQ